MPVAARRVGIVGSDADADHGVVGSPFHTRAIAITDQVVGWAKTRLAGRLAESPGL
jgi:hypothetical protein